jgi:hypothetical protein
MGLCVVDSRWLSRCYRVGILLNGPRQFVRREQALDEHSVQVSNLSKPTALNL